MYGNRTPFLAAPPPAPYVNLHGGGEVFDPSSYAQQNGPPSYAATWVWIDLETSGLNPNAANFGILEIAAVVTSDDLTVQDTLHLIVNQPPAVIAHASRWCAAHFSSRHDGGNDLFDQCRASSISEAQAGHMLKEFIVKHSAVRRRPQLREDPRRELFRAVEFGDLEQSIANEGEEGDASSTSARRQQQPQNVRQHVYRVMLAGCSCYFDRQVLLTRFPFLQAHISHKLIDMTSVLEIARRFRPDMLRTLRGPSNSHRALQDILESLNILRWFYMSILVVGSM